MKNRIAHFNSFTRQFVKEWWRERASKFVCPLPPSKSPHSSPFSSFTSHSSFPFTSTSPSLPPPSSSLDRYLRYASSQWLRVVLEGYFDRVEAEVVVVVARKAVQVAALSSESGQQDGVVTGFRMLRVWESLALSLRFAFFSLARSLVTHKR